MSVINAAEYQVSGLYLRAWLSGLRRISGGHYPYLLEKCNLSQFATHYPAADMRVVASGVEIMQLSRAVYDFLGAAAFNLFMLNLGREFARTASTLPLLKAKASALAPVNNLPTLVQLLEFMLEHNRQVVHEHINLKVIDATTIQLDYLDCIYCASLPQMPRPACPGIGAFWSQLIFELTNRRLYIEEIGCGAMHHEHNCQFLLHC